MNAADEHGAAEPVLMDVVSVARLLGCCKRHVYRLAGSGRMPRPVKLGALVRWNRSALQCWVDAGCPALRSEGVAP
jgi:excisionase family DNA binding protein